MNTTNTQGQDAWIDALELPQPYVVVASWGEYAGHFDEADLRAFARKAVAEDRARAKERARAEVAPLAGIDVTLGAELHPLTASLVVRFARALSKKLAAAEVKYGYSDGWRSPEWMDECRRHLANLVSQIFKGSPTDDHGHLLTMNTAYLRAAEFLATK
jgi:hypothetical protein